MIQALMMAAMMNSNSSDHDDNDAYDRAHLGTCCHASQNDLKDIQQINSKLYSYAYHNNDSC